MKTVLLLQVVLATTYISVDVWGADPQDKVEAEVSKAKEAYKTAVKKADEKILVAYDRKVGMLREAKMVAEERLKMIDVVEAEKAAFEKTGRLPLSAPMRSATVEYLKATRAAATPLEKAFDKAIDFHTKAKALDRAKEYLAAKKEILKPTVFAVCDYSIGPGKVDRWEFLSDGTINGGPATWSLEMNLLVCNFPEPKVRGGYWIDTFQFSPDGKTITGKNQLGHPKSGKFVESK